MSEDATTARLKLGETIYSRVHALRVDEFVSQPFRAEVELSCEPLDVEALRGVSAAIEVVHRSGAVRHLAGVVDVASVTISPALRAGERVRHRVVVVPAAWWSLRYRKGFRIFQDLDALAIVRQVLEEGGVAPERLVVDVARALSPRTYCVQYDERDWDFVARLLEDEGIHYTHTHDADGWTLTLRDRSHDSARAEPFELPFLASANPDGPALVCWSGETRVRVVETAARVDGYDPERPSLSLGADASADGPVSRRSYTWPGTHADPTANSREASSRLDALRRDRHVVTLRSNAVSLQPGQRVSLLDHPWAEGERFITAMRWELVVEPSDGDRALRHSGARGLRVELRTTPAEGSWEPPRATPRPRVMGMQTARVTGPAGEEVYTDAQGRVKVQFHWDLEGELDERSSCWMRVSQGHTTGSMMIPRVGWEVLVEFVDGDPDRPVCLGKLWNPMHTPHITLPAGRTQSSFSSVSSPGGAGVNSVIFEDQAGAEEIAVTGSYDVRVVAANDKVVTVGNASTATVGADRAVTVGANDTAAVLANYRARAGGDESVSVGGSRARRVSGSLTEEIGGAFSLSVGAMEHLKIGSVASAVLQVVRDEVIEASVGAAAAAASRAQAALLGPIMPALSGAQAAMGRASRLAGPAAALLGGGDPSATMFGNATNALTANPGALDGAAAASSLARSLANQALNPAPAAGGDGGAGGAAAATGGGAGVWSTVVGGDVSESIGGAQVLNALAGLSVTIGGSNDELIGAASLTLAGGGISETTGTSKAEQVGAYVVNTSGSAAISAQAALAMTVAGAERVTASGSHSIAAKGPLVVNTPTLQIKGGGSITLSCGACKVVIDGGGVAIEGAAMVKIKGGVVVLDESVMGT